MGPGSLSMLVLMWLWQCGHVISTGRWPNEG